MASGRNRHKCMMYSQALSRGKYELWHWNLIAYAIKIRRYDFAYNNSQAKISL